MLFTYYKVMPRTAFVFTWFDPSSELCGMQVPGCRTDIAAEGPYSRKSKACKLHRLAPLVEISGKMQRFCQQCSRFEAADLFDGVNRYAAGAFGCVAHNVPVRLRASQDHLDPGLLRLQIH